MEMRKKAKVESLLKLIKLDLQRVSKDKRAQEHVKRRQEQVREKTGEGYGYCKRW